MKKLIFGVVISVISLLAACGSEMDMSESSLETNTQEFNKDIGGLKFEQICGYQYDSKTHYCTVSYLNYTGTLDTWYAGVSTGKTDCQNRGYACGVSNQTLRSN